MPAWSKEPLPRDSAYGVVAKDGRFGVAVYKVGEAPQRVHNVGMRRTEDKLQAAADRLNSRSGISPAVAMHIVEEAKKWMRKHKVTGLQRRESPRPRTRSLRIIQSTMPGVARTA